LKPNFGKSNITEKNVFKKITTLFLAMMIFTTALSLSVSGQSNLSDENQAVSQNAEAKKNDKLREALAKKDNQSSTPNFDKRETMADYQNQKKQGQKFSTSTKVLIGVGITVAVVGVVVFVASRDKINTF
jgi:flagellar basal body-associated protein FliL